jgi:hypothetical protein
MTTELHDTALPRFEDRLWDELSEAHRQRQDQRPAVVTPHRPNRRRRPLAVGAAVAVAAATTLVIGLATLPGGKPQPASASVEKRIVTATDGALSRSVVHTVDDFVPASEGNDRETWYDATTGAARTRDVDDQGAVVFDDGPATRPEPGDRTRIERRVQACDATYADTAGPALPVDLVEMHARDDIAAGRLVVDGTEVVDGRELIRLRQPADPEASGSVEQTLYVDPDSYLPVELRSDAGGPDENVVRFEYLPRTAANLALLSPPVPEGYAEVAQLTPCS